MTGIAAEAGVSVGAIYHHFSGRSGLIAAARAEQFRRTTDRDLAEILQAVRTAESFRDFEPLDGATCWDLTEATTAKIIDVAPAGDTDRPRALGLG